MVQVCSRSARRLFFALLIFAAGSGWALGQAPQATPPGAAPTASPTPAVAPPAASQPEAPVPPDKVVLKVGEQQFTRADIDRLIQYLPAQVQRAIAAQGKRPLGDQYALMVMLAQQARAQHLDQSPAFVQKLTFQKEQLEAQTAVEAINEQVKITPEDLQQYYTAHSAEYDELTLRQVVVRKKPMEPKPDPAHPAALTGQGVSPEEAKTRADSIRKELLAGRDVKTILAEFKQGDVIIDAEPRKIRRGGMPADMEKVAFALKDGEISDPVDKPQALLFFQVIGHGHLEQKEVTPEIEKVLHQQKVEAALADVKKTNPVWMDDQYFGGPNHAPAGPTLGSPPH